MISVHGQEIRVDCFRVILLVYFLAFGLLGYGSSLTLENPKSLVPALAGFAVSIVFALVNRRPSLIWAFTKKSASKNLLTFLAVFALMLFLGRQRLASELFSDELAYVWISTTHAREILSRFGVFEGQADAGILVQFATLTVIACVIVFITVVISVKNTRFAIVSVATVTLCLQLIYSLFGGWDWHYADISWFPHMVAYSIFGLSPHIFALTSVVIVSVGFTALFRMTAKLELAVITRIILVLAVATLPTAVNFYASLDHIVYHLAFGLPILIELLRRPDIGRLRLTLLALSIGVVFRLTLVVLLFPVLVRLFKACKVEQRSLLRELILSPGAILLVPYSLGIALHPPLSGQINSPIPLLGSANLIPNFAMLFGSIAGTEIAFILLLSAGFVSGVVYSRTRLETIGIFLSYFLVYCVLLSDSGLENNPKYFLEWGVMLAAWSALALATLTQEHPRRTRQKYTFQVISIAIFTMVTSANALSLSSLPSWPGLGYGEQQKPLSRPVSKYEETQLFLINKGHDNCTPVGYVSGATNELLYNRSLDSYLYAEKTFAQLKTAQLESGLGTAVVTEEILGKVSSTCFYGSRSDFDFSNTQSLQVWNEILIVEGRQSKDDIILIRLLN